MRPFKFLHAADLHLDSPFRGVTADAPAVAERLRNATFAAFDALVEAAVAERVDFVLVAGDVYDGADRSLRAQLKFRDGLARLADHGIPSFVVHGNHDHLEGWTSAISWPEKVTVFGSRVETVDVVAGGETIARVTGVSFAKRNEQRNLAKTFRPDASGHFQIGLLHCNVGSDTGHDPYAPCELADLSDGAIDYWALGHVHTRQVLRAYPHVVYPGNIQGRHVREAGPRGAVLVIVDETRHVEVDFVPLDVVRWEWLRVGIDGLETLDALDDRLFGAVDAALASAEGRPLICRVTVEGRGPLYRDLSRERAERDLVTRLREHYERKRPFVWVQEVSVAVRPEADLDDRSRAEDLLAVALRIAGELRSDPERLDELYKSALAPLYENGRAAKALSEKPGRDEVAAILDDAELICFDRLEGTAS